jgi:hypothetical protein
VSAREVRASLLAAFLIVAASDRAAAADAPAPAAPYLGATGSVPEMVKTVFDRRFAFCHDPSYPLTGDEVSWCALMPGAGKDGDPRCPRFAEACRRGETASLVRRRRMLSGEGLAIPGALAWVLLGIGVIVVVSALVSQSLAQAAPAGEEPPEPAPGAAAAAPELRRAVETDVQRLLDRARAAAAAGDFARGLADAYAAWLRRLEGEGIVRVETGRTNGDHLRQVRGKLPAAARPMREIIGTVERVQFGGDVPDEGTFRSVHDGVLRLLSESFPARAGLLLVLACLLGSVTGCMGQRGNWAESPSGRSGVIALLGADGLDVRERFQSLAKLDGSVQQLLLMPEVAVETEDWKLLDTWVSTGGTLLVAGGGRVLPSFIPVKLVAAKTKAPGPIVVAEDRMARFGSRTAVVPPGAALELPADASALTSHHASYDIPDDTPWPLLSRSGEPYAAEETHGAGRVIVLADDALFTNVSLLAASNAELLLELLSTGGKRVDLADEVTGLVSANPLTSVQRGRLAPAMLQLALLTLLFFAYKGAHFGRPVDPVAVRRRAFSEHARALGTRYAQARAARHALGLYGAFALERLRERLHLAGGKGLGAMAEAVAARSRRPLGDVMRVLVEARPDAAPAEALAAEENDLATLREIATLLVETGGAGERNRNRIER